MQDLRELRYFLGIKVIRSPSGIWLLQRQYGLDMSKYGMTSYKPMSIPLEQNVKLNAKKGELLEDFIVYKCIIGSLIYMTITRPYLSYIVGLVSQFMQAPRKPHLDAARHILRYVKTTLQYGLFYEAGCPIQVHGYIDADWASSIFDRRSTSGLMFSL